LRIFARPSNAVADPIRCAHVALSFNHSSVPNGTLVAPPLQSTGRKNDLTSSSQAPSHARCKNSLMPGSRFAGRGKAARYARQPFRWDGRRCGQCQAAISRGAAALAVSPERVVAGALGGPAGTASAGSPCLPRTPHCPPPARAPLPGAQCSCAAVAHRLPPPST